MHQEGPEVHHHGTARECAELPVATLPAILAEEPNREVRCFARRNRDLANGLATPKPPEKQSEQRDDS